MELIFTEKQDQTKVVSTQDRRYKSGLFSHQKINRRYQANLNFLFGKITR